MKKQILLLLLFLSSFALFSQSAKFHRIKILGENAKDVCDYYSGNNTTNNNRKINFYGLSFKLTVGKLYYVNSKYFIVTQSTDVYEQDRDDDWYVNTQPNPIINYYCKKYVKLKKIGNYYSQANNNYCTNRSLDEIKVNFYWTGSNLIVNQIYKINSKYYKVLFVSNRSNQDADENWYGTNITNPINFTCKKYHKLKKLGTTLNQVYSNCNSGYGQEIKVNLINTPNTLVLNKVYKINNIFYRVVYSSNFQNQDADDDLYVNSIVGPYIINVGNCLRPSKDLREIKETSIYSIQGVKIKTIYTDDMDEVRKIGLKRGIYILKTKNRTRKVFID